MIGVITMNDMLEDVFNACRDGDLIRFRRAVEVLASEYSGDTQWTVLCKNAGSISRSQMGVLCRSIIKHFEENYE